MNRTKSKQEKFNTMLYDYFITNTFQNRRTSEKFRTTLSNSDYRLNEERIVVYRKGKILDKSFGKGYYLVEFSYDNNDFIINVSDIDTQDEYIRKFPKTIAKKIIKFYQYDYDAMADNLMIDGNQLIVNKMAKSKNFNTDFGIDKNSNLKRNEILIGN